MIGITFGRFRIIHNGHLEMLRRMLAENDEIIIGVSEQSMPCRPAETLKSLLGEDFSRVTIIYSKNPFLLMKEVEAEQGQVLMNFYAGADRANMLARISKYYEISQKVVIRLESSPSSTQCRECLKDGFNADQLINRGLAESYLHATLIFAQYCLGVSN